MRKRARRGGGAEDNAATTVQTNWEVKKWAIPDLVFFIFVFLVQLTVNVQYNFLPMTGFKLRISGLEATALPTESQPLPNELRSCCFVGTDTQLVILRL